MKDAKCAETIQKSVFWFLRFLGFEIWSFFYSKLVNFSINFEYKIDHNSKNKSRKNRKIDLLLRIFSVNFTIFEWLVFFLVGDTLENTGVSPVNCIHNQP